MLLSASSIAQTKRISLDVKEQSFSDVINQIEQQSSYRVIYNSSKIDATKEVTISVNNKSLETYFLGYDSEHQHSNQLYLNMLYDMAVYAINNGFESVVYARTAMEIKSSVGAQPEPMFIYLKYTNSFVNALLKQIFNLMNPTQKWEERRPFKK